MEFRAKEVDLYLHQQGIDTSTPAGKAMYQMLGVFAEFEREMIRERVLAGMARARSQGKHLGRPRVDADVEAAVRATLTSGTGIVRTARLHGVGVGTVQRIAKGS
jgi:DNA invertase Pin-like site-specific DNA recombinase